MPRRAPERIRSTADLRAFQRLMLEAVIRPLGPGNRARRTWTDGRPAAAVIDTFAAANDRLSGLERVEIYNRMYWFRTLDSLYEDLPGLRAVLGERRFLRLIESYLERHPSRSFTLRDLPARLEKFIRRTPRLTAPYTALAVDMAAFEWAQIECFDAAAHSPLTPADLAGVPVGRLRLAVQPHVRLLALRYPVDEFALAVKDAALRGDASNAITAAGRRERTGGARVQRPRPAPTWLAVHRHEGRIYYKRLEEPAYRILMKLRAGRSLTQAVSAAGRGMQPDQVRAWFTTWMQLGWFCRR